MKSETGAILKRTTAREMAARRRGRSRGHPLTRLEQPMGRKTKTGCCSTTNDNVSTVKLTQKQNIQNKKRSKTQDAGFTPLYPERI